MPDWTSITENAGAPAAGDTVVGLLDNESAEDRWTFANVATRIDTQLYDSGSTAIGSGVATIAVTYSAAHTNAAIVGGLVIVNTTDATPRRIRPELVTANSTTGFTVQLSGTTNTANFVLHWWVIRV